MLKPILGFMGFENLIILSDKIKNAKPIRPDETNIKTTKFLKKFQKIKQIFKFMVKAHDRCSHRDI